MENCLVKKLKGVVDNDNLKKYNVVYIEVSNNGKSGDLVIAGKFGTTLSTDGAGTFTVGSDATVRTTYTFDSDIPVTMHFSEGNYNIELSSKYEQSINIINSVNIRTNFSVDLSQFNYITKLINFTIFLSDVKGEYVVSEETESFLIYSNSISDAVIRLKDNTTYTRLISFGSPNIKSIPINIERLGQCTRLSSISASSATDISGELDTLFAALHTAGKVSGSIDVYAFSGNVTDEGNIVNLDYIIRKGGTTCIGATFTSEGYIKTYK